ncbi:hypothetical protein GGR54DRAFT_552304 [Hypoxylon sp. NC1633]|nr:hypothetical protein GGR54DRAFT_552304 [Hypoxylon sp. NC1633]
MGGTTMRTSKHGPASSTRLRQVVVVSVICLALYCFLLVPDHSLDSSRSSIIDTFPQSQSHSTSGAKPPPELLNNRFLTTSQCLAAFPGLTQEIDDVVSQGPFTLRRNPHGLGPTIARIRGGKLSILSYARRADLSKDMLQHRTASLHQIAAALLTAPPTDPALPDTIFALNHEDAPATPSLSYARAADPVRRRRSSSGSGPVLPMPHFGFYAWPIRTVGSFERASAAITHLEARTPWTAKDRRAVWRGTVWFEDAGASGGTGLRHSLLARAGRGASQDAGSWADVEALAANGSNALAIEDFCRHRYVIHTEGVTYSGRFQYHQQCASVVLSPPIAWMQHVTHLVKPVFSYALDGVERSPPPPHSPPSTHPHSPPSDPSDPTTHTTTPKTSPPKPRPLPPYPAPWVRSAWPVSHDALTAANIVFVAPDWSDLEATVAWLEQHPKEAASIAARQRALFADAGYLSPAAEMCYWRAALRGWAAVACPQGQGFEDLEEIPWEEFSLREVHK